MNQHPCAHPLVRRDEPEYYSLHGATTPMEVFRRVDTGNRLAEGLPEIEPILEILGTSQGIPMIEGFPRPRDGIPESFVRRSLGTRPRDAIPPLPQESAGPPPSLARLTDVTGSWWKRSSILLAAKSCSSLEVSHTTTCPTCSIAPGRGQVTASTLPPRSLGRCTHPPGTRLLLHSGCPEEQKEVS